MGKNGLLGTVIVSVVTLAAIGHLSLATVSAAEPTFRKLAGSGAQDDEVRDPDDADGRFDVLRLRHGVGKSGRIWHSLKMATKWKGKLFKTKRNDINMWLSTDHEEENEEWRIFFDYRFGNLRAFLMFHSRNGDVISVSAEDPVRIHLNRPNRKTVRVSFSPKEIGDPKRYAWSVSTAYRSEECNLCHDRAPGGEGMGRFEHDLSD